MNLNNTQWMNVVFFVKACCCMMVARKLLLGTTTTIATVAAHTHTATVATNSISSSVRSFSSLASPSSSSVTMMAMTAGSRTLIEIGNNNNNSHNDNLINTQKEFEIDVSYLDDDYENGLLILRRRVDVANIGIEDEEEDQFGSCQVGLDSMMAHTKSPRNESVLHKVSMAFKKNPFMASSTCTCILLGNIASMIGIIPIGLSGFVPAVSIMATVGILHKK